MKVEIVDGDTIGFEAENREEQLLLFEISERGVFRVASIREDDEALVAELSLESQQRLEKEFQVRMYFQREAEEEIRRREAEDAS